MKILSNFNVNFKSNLTNISAKKYNNLSPLLKDTVSFGANQKQESDIPGLKAVQDKITQLEKDYEKLETDFESLKQKCDELSQRYAELLVKKDAKTEEEKEEQAQIPQEITDLRHSLIKMSKSKKHGQNQIEAYKKYYAQLQLNPKTAFLYNPDLPMKQKTIQASEEGILTADELVETTGITRTALTLFLQNEKLDYEEAGSKKIKYFDPSTDKNREFLASIEPMLKNALSPVLMGAKYNLGEDDTAKLLKEGKLKVIGLDGSETFKGTIQSALIDSCDEDNIAAFEKYANTNYHPSKYFDMAGKRGAYLPASYLSKIGYGEIKNIRSAIQKGLIGGRIEQVETPQGIKTRTMVDISDRTKLRSLFYDAIKDGYTLTMNDFASRLGIMQSRLKAAVEQGEIEIINEYLLAPVSSQRDVRYFDVRNEKNQKFIEKIKQEKELEKAQKAKEREENKILRAQKMKAIGEAASLRMSIVWALCPKTKQTGSDLAKPDGYLCSLLRKEDEGEKLTRKEEIVVNNYRKNMWLTQGTEEFKQAQARANEYLKLYAQEGLEAIDNEDVKEVFRLYFSEKNDIE